MTKHTVTAYTDGASKGNPGPGGWGVVLRDEATGATKHLAGAAPNTTNNAMELLAAIHALISLRAPSEITILTDSRYVADGWNDWLPGWMANGWRNARGKPVRNAELWQALIEAAEPHTVTIAWVRGHNGHNGNEQADRLASGAAEHVARTGEVGPWARRIT
jgi:ribonuclease HI